jgi:putative membrane protein
MNIFVSLLIRTVIILLASYILPGVSVDGFWAALLLAVVLGLINTFVRPLVIFFTLPATLVTLGLFLFIINALMVMLADWLLASFSVAGFGWALLFSIVVSLISSLLERTAKSHA